MKVGVTIAQKPNLERAHRVSHLFLARKQGWNHNYRGAVLGDALREIESREVLRPK